MLTTEDGKAKCVACGLCPTVCPANCIKLVPGEDEDGNRYPLVFEIDEFRCIFCGYCQEVCPEEAIHVGRHYENSEYSRDGFVYDLERLMAQTHPVSRAVGSRRPEGRVMTSDRHGARDAPAALHVPFLSVRPHRRRVGAPVRHAQESRRGGAVAREHDVLPRRAVRAARRAVHRRSFRCSSTPARSWWCSCS